MSRYFKNSFSDYKHEFANQLPAELNEISNVLESKQYFLSYLNQIDSSSNDIYVGKYGILLLYYFLQKKSSDKFRQNFLDFYSSCIGKFE